MLDLHLFLDFLRNDELISGFASKIKQDFHQKSAVYQKFLARETQEAIAIKDALINQYPELDDSTALPPTGIESTFDWESTFAYFNKVVTESLRIGYPLRSEMLDDSSDVRKLLDVLSNKVALYNHRAEKTEGGQKMDTSVSNRVTDLERAHTYTHREWINYARVSAGNSYHDLEGIIARINPEPKDLTDSGELDKLDKLNQVFGQTMEDRKYLWITDATYGVISQYSNYHPSNLTSEQLEKIFDSLKHQLKRVYEAVRQEIGTTRLLLQILDRYRMRCHWYDQESVRSLVLNQAGEFISNREDRLTRHLALYVFDLGITVIYRARFGKHEVDLLELDAEQPMFIEVKAYKDSSSKADLVSGVSQLHGYLSSLDAHKNISEAYYVMYRIGGPIYELPRRISTSRFTIYPILVDLGLSSESGRNQPKPILISEEEIMNEII
jgi:hypothetical protein